MKYRYLFIGLLSTLALSCTMEEVYSPDDLDGSSSPKNRVFYVSIDEQPDVDTKVYAGEDLRILWNKDDRVSIFNKDTYNQEYRFEGENGANSGAITPVGNDGEGSPLDMIYAVYPYQESTSISTSGVISFDMPAVQYYEENTFGLEANTMLSVTDTSMLKFKNVGGYIALKMYGTDVKVSSIILRGNNNELLAGPSTIEMTENGPSVSIIASTASKQIKLYCNDPVELGSSSNSGDCKIFWIVVPPVEFTGGFSVTVATPDGKTFTQSTTKPFSIKRSAVTRLAPFEVTPTGTFGASLSTVSSTRPIAMSDGGEQDKTYTAKYDDDTRTFSILLPTITDLSNDVTFDYVHTGDKLLANGKEVQSGDHIQAEGLETTLTLVKGDAEMRYKLKVTNTGLPVVRITTKGFTRETIEADASHTNWRGYKAKDSNNALIPGDDASIRIEMPDGKPGLIDKDGNPYEVKTQIRGRGNATWTYPKRPYALKFDKKSSVLEMPAHKRWILLANWKDRTLLRNDAALWLSKQTKERTGSEGDIKLGLPYTVRGQFVELEFNGVHRGNYYLCEHIKIDPERVNITEMKEKETGATDPNAITGGYVVEIDNNWDEDNSFKSGVFDFKYQFKIPDEEERSSQAYDYMTHFIDTVENYIYALRSNTNSPYKDFFDIDSAIWFMFVNELTGNGDFFNHDQQWAGASSEWYGPHSTYFYKDRNTFDSQGNMVRSKLHMGPVWDFDYLTFMPSRSSQWVGVNQKKYYFNFLLNDPAFKSRMTTLWGKYYPNLSTEFATYVGEVAETIRVSQGFDEEMWWKASGDQRQNKDYDCKDFDEAVGRVKKALKDKIDWMNTNNRIGKLSYQSSTVP